MFMIISIVCLSARIYVYMCTVHVRKREFDPVRVAMYAQRKRDISTKRQALEAAAPYSVEEITELS